MGENCVSFHMPLEHKFFKSNKNDTVNEVNSDTNNSSPSDDKVRIPLGYKYPYVDVKSIHPTLPYPINSGMNIWGRIKYMLSTDMSTYHAVDNIGINKQNASKPDICLAEYSKIVAEEMQTIGNCYTGVKYALLNSGVIDDYADMPKGSAHDAIQYFEKNTNKFEKVEVEKDKLKDLPAGHIIVYTKQGKPGHIIVTNGHGQGMSDWTDNMKWLEKEGEGAESHVYKLKTDAWKYDEVKKKNIFIGQPLESSTNKAENEKK